MRKYWFLFKVVLQNRLVDRANFYLEMLGNTLVTFALIAIWSLASSQGGLTRGMNAQTLTVYFVAAGALMGFYRRSQGDEIADDIYRGTLSFWLVKPMHPLIVWMLRDFAIRMIELPFLAVMSALLLTTYHAWDAVSFSFGHLVWFGVFLSLATWLHFLLFSCFSLMAFWLDQTWGERFVLNVVMEIASGALIPLAFFSPFWQHTLHLLPFSYMVAIPVEFLLGLRTPAQSWSVFLLMGFWITTGMIFIRMLWGRGVRRYEGVGI